MVLKDRIGLRHALIGLKTAFLKERNFRIHLFFTVIVLFLSCVLGLNKFEWIVILLVISLVLVTELLNSVIERLIDYFKPEYTWQAKEIKDISAGFVLITAIFAVLIGLIIFIPKIF